MTTARMQGTMVIAWLWVSVPFAYGLYELILKARNLFST